uniref:SEC7 domain-containing protein n=1 Tax=viral metagenome TaxID=1070528 RepID=A0A6C0LQ81_9ZZZZ
MNFRNTKKRNVNINKKYTRSNRQIYNKKMMGGDYMLQEHELQSFNKFIQKNLVNNKEDGIIPPIRGLEDFLTEETTEANVLMDSQEYIDILSPKIESTDHFDTKRLTLSDFNKYYNKTFADTNNSKENKVITTFKQLIIDINTIIDDNDSLNKDSDDIKLLKIMNILYKSYHKEDEKNIWPLNKCLGNKTIKKYLIKYIIILLNTLAYNKSQIIEFNRANVLESIKLIGRCNRGINKFFPKEFFTRFERYLFGEEDKNTFKTNMKNMTYQSFVQNEIMNYENLYEKGFVSSSEMIKAVENTANKTIWLENPAIIQSVSVSTGIALNLAKVDPTSVSTEIHNSIHNIQLANALGAIATPILAPIITYFALYASTQMYKFETIQKLQKNYDINNKFITWLHSTGYLPKQISVTSGIKGKELPVIQCPTNVDDYFTKLTKYFTEINKIITGYFDRYMYKLQFYLDIYKIICENSLNPEPIKIDDPKQKREADFNDYHKILEDAEKNIARIDESDKNDLHDKLNEIFKFLEINEFEEFKTICPSNVLSRQQYKNIIKKVKTYFTSGEKAKDKDKLVTQIKKTCDRRIAKAAEK